MLVEVALPGRERLFLHPAVLLAKVRGQVLDQGVQHRRQDFVGRALLVAQAGHKFLVQVVHGRMAEQEFVVPGQRAMFGSGDGWDGV